MNRGRGMHFLLAAAMLLAGAGRAADAGARTVQVAFTVKEIRRAYDNKGEHSVFAWTYEGQIPGPLVRVTEGDTVEFTLVNPAGSRNAHSMKNDWKHVVFNGTPFKYDPMHAIGGIWDTVYASGNPKNAMTGLQSFVVGPGDAAIFDLVSPRAGHNALVSHSMRAAHAGAMALIEFRKDASETAGRGDHIILH